MDRLKIKTNKCWGLFEKKLKIRSVYDIQSNEITIVEDLNSRHNEFKEFKKRNSKQIYNDIQNKIKYNIKKIML